MPTNTSRLALSQPAGGDGVVQLRTSIGANATTLDGAAMFLTGLLVNRPAASIYGRWYFATDDTSSGSSIGTAWFDNGSAWSSGWNPPSRGAVNIATSQSTTSASAVLLATPDQVTGIVMPTNGLIKIGYQATWSASSGSTAEALIYLNSTAVVIADMSASTSPTAPVALTTHTTDVPLCSYPGGLTTSSPAGTYTGDVSTGQIVGTSGGLGGLCALFAAAGTYTVSIRFLNSGSIGTTSVKNRKLWVYTLPFS